ncbi:MAG: putative Fe-S cluster assembly protein SufT [Chthoniobacterales bacterium]
MSDPRENPLTRDCDAIQIPSGNPVILPAGMNVIITQSLGGTYTVATPAGLARISEKDIDALGIDPQAAEAEKKEASASGTPGEVSETEVWNRLKTVYDPEIPVNIVDLGLVYDCRIEKQDQGAVVNVQMTLTAPGCGMGPTIAADARSKILSIDGVTDASVDLVWDPPWNQGMITEAGKMKLGLI